jgi:glycine cleavage system transcriptional repressor
MEAELPRSLCVTIIGNDRPGIVAGAAEVLYRLGCNIEDSSCTILGGEFAMILIVSHKKPFSKSQLLDDFKTFGKAMQLSVFVRPLTKDAARYQHLSVKSAYVGVRFNQPGIVYCNEGACHGRSISVI